jgi:hypothetical protein
MQAAEKVDSRTALVAQPPLAVRFSRPWRVWKALERENRTAKSGCATFSASCIRNDRFPAIRIGRVIMNEIIPSTIQYRSFLKSNLFCS